MKPVLTAQQSREQDRAANAALDVLLDRAGLSVALEAARLGAMYGWRVAILAGNGNNGGDGYVAARYLRQRGVAVDLYPLADPKTSVLEQARDAAIASGAHVRDWDDRRHADLVIDALFGGGFRGDLPDLSAWRDSRYTLAVDVASGLDASTGAAAPGALVADATVTFHGPRVGHLIGEGPEYSGVVRVADIGLPDVQPEFWLCEEADAPLPMRARTAHKWSAGSVLVVGGSAGLDGAATLTARSALRAGAGAVMLACPKTVEDRVRSPEIMTRAISEGDAFSPADVGAVLDLANGFDIVLIGPGLGPSVGSFVQDVLDGTKQRVLVDADALNALDGVESLRRGGETIITPHAGEFARLTGNDASHRSAADLARASSATVLLKGGPTFVMGGAQRWVVTTGGRELATIGTGDVLAGMIGAFWAGGLDTETAALSGAYWHGRTAADLQRSRTVTADQLVEHVGVLTKRP